MCRASRRTFLFSFGFQYDALIVDEAQDFHADWWLPIQLLLRDPDHGQMYLFHDPNQAAVYGHGDAYPAEGMLAYDLSENCRNTRRISAYCGEVIEKTINPFKLSPEGVIPQIIDWAQMASQRAQLARRAVIGLLAEQFKPSRIAILSPWRRGSPHSSLTHLDKIDNVPVSGSEEAIEQWLDAKAIWGSTIKAFKGLEADCVIVADIPVTGITGFSISDMYVAVSRAKHRVILIPASSEAEAQIKTWAECARLKKNVPAHAAS
jgi:UvrD-like helicase family protein